MFKILSAHSRYFIKRKHDFSTQSVRKNSKRVMVNFSRWKSDVVIHNSEGVLLHKLYFHPPHGRFANPYISQFFY